MSITLRLIIPSLLETYKIFCLKFIPTLLGFFPTFRVATTISDEPFMTEIVLSPELVT